MFAGLDVLVDQLEVHILERMLRLADGEDPHFRVLVGLEQLSFPMLAIGAAGMVNAVGNLAPGRVAELYQAVADGKLEEGRRLHFELNELNQAVFFDNNPIAIKYMMTRIGLLPRDEHRLPMIPPTPEVAARLDGVLERSGLTGLRSHGGHRRRIDAVGQ